MVNKINNHCAKTCPTCWVDPVEEEAAEADDGDEGKEYGGGGTAENVLETNPECLGDLAVAPPPPDVPRVGAVVCCVDPIF